MTGVLNALIEDLEKMPDRRVIVLLVDTLRATAKTARSNQRHQVADGAV